MSTHGTQSFGYSPVAKEEDGDKQHKGVGRKLWAPFFLRRPVMIVFLVSFLSILGTLIALYVYTERQHRSLGITTDGDKYYYLWTYGPTAVFTILTAGWTQVEYRAAQLMPWIQMLRGPTPAAESIFLDYLSEWNIVSLYKSIRQKHYLVSLCVAGSLLLNAVTVFSTGLFELDAVQITRPSTLTITHKFDSANFNPIMNDVRPFAACIAFSQRNMTRPIGLHDPYVYTPFQPSSLGQTNNATIPANRYYQVETEVFEPFFDCENATASVEPSNDMMDDDNHREVYTSADGCRFPYRNIPDVLIEDSKTGIGIEAFVGGCHGERLSANELNVMPNVTWDVDWTLWAAVAPTFQDAPQEVQVTHAGWEKRPIHAIMCKPRYNLYRGPVRIWREQGQSAISADIQAGSLNVTEGIPNVTGAKLLYSAMQSAVQTEEMDGSQYVFAANGTSRDVFFTDTAAFTRAISDSFSCLVRQIAKNELLREEPYDVQGTEQLIEERLFVRQLSFWLMAILLVCLSGVVSILLAFFAPVAVCPRDTGSIGGVATILAQSPEFMKRFQGSQLKSESAMAGSSLGRTRYTSSATHEGTFMLIPQDDERPTSTSQPAQSMEASQPTWWRPFSSSWFIRIPVVVIPVAVIIALEVVYHISSSARGITLVQGKSPYIHYIWVYIPALIMFAIRCLFQSVEFGARVVQPYARLRQGAAPPETSILENQLRKIAIYGVFDTLRKKQWALAAATTSLLLAGVTPIVVSGLYTANTSWPTSPMNLTQTTRWNLGDTNSLEPSQAGKYYQPTDFATDNVPGLILHLNLSYPQWTYHDLAFPQFTLTTTNNNTDHPLPPEAEALGYIDVRLPALRSHLTCAPDPTNGGCFFKKSINSLECDRDEACFTTMGMSPPWQSGGQYFFQGSPPQANGENANCPTHAMLYGQWNADNTAAAKFYYITCNASIEEVDVDVRLQVPSFSFDPESPPKVVPGSARRDIPTNRSSFPGLEDMRQYLFNVNPTPYDRAGGDTLLQAAVSGVGGVPNAQLLSQPEILIDRVNEIWGITLAQLFNTGGRESFSAPLNRSWAVLPVSTTPPVYAGVFHDGRRYLVQSEISTRILDGILAGMVLCALISLGLMRTKRVLPKNPCSIAAVASFLNGARMLATDVIPREAQWCGDEALKKIFEGRRFTMGWWVVDRGSETSNITTRHDNHWGEDSASDTEVSERDTRGSPDDAGISHSEQRATRFGIDVDVVEERFLLKK